MGPVGSSGAGEWAVLAGCDVRLATIEPGLRLACIDRHRA